MSKPKKSTNWRSCLGHQIIDHMSRLRLGMVEERQNVQMNKSIKTTKQETWQTRLEDDRHRSLLDRLCKT